jgi:hypothetical protein
MRSRRRAVRRTVNNRSVSRPDRENERSRLGAAIAGYEQSSPSSGTVPSTRYASTASFTQSEPLL